MIVQCLVPIKRLEMYFFKFLGIFSVMVCAIETRDILT